MLYSSIVSLAKVNYLRTSKLFPALMGYSATPTGYEPGPAFDYKFLIFEAAAEPASLEFDVVIVGSGVGGGVSAKNLAEAGFSVLVVDKAYYHPPDRLPMNEAAGYTHLFENGGFDATYDASLTFIAGANWGGGGSINWSASLQPQSYVRQEWSRDRKLPLFETTEFQDALDRVCDRMGVSTENIEHSHGNKVLLEGARKLGYEAKAVPQNTGGHKHSCGRCGMGCGAAEKQGPNVCWLPDAARAGAQFMEGYQVERVLFETRGGNKTAVGVKGVWTKNGVEREVVVKAQRVIVSAGSLNSPVLLLNSGLKVRYIPLLTQPINNLTEHKHRPKPLHAPRQHGLRLLPRRRPPLGRRNPNHSLHLLREPRRPRPRRQNGSNMHDPHPLPLPNELDIRPGLEAPRRQIQAHEHLRQLRARPRRGTHPRKPKTRGIHPLRLRSPTHPHWAS